MIPITFKESNHVFTKPTNMTDEQCGELEVFVGRDSANFPVIISKWQLSKEDIETINEKGHIYLSIIGHGMPPVWISPESPFVSG